jgi:hypothetical protein
MPKLFCQVIFQNKNLKTENILRFKKGIHKITKNLYVKEKMVLVFDAVAKIFLAAGISIHKRGKVFANGTKINPVIFEPLNKNEPWGTIFIQGKGGNGSTFRHSKFHLDQMLL